MAENNPVVSTEIRHEDNERGGAFFVERGGRRVARMTYQRARPPVIVIDHTEVDESLSGQGVGRMLLDALVAWARATGTRVRVTCPYARAQFARDPSIGDVLDRPIR